MKTIPINLDGSNIDLLDDALTEAAIMALNEGNKKKALDYTFLKSDILKQFKAGLIKNNNSKKPLSRINFFTW